MLLDNRDSARSSMLPAEGGEQKDWGKRGEILFPNDFTAKSGKFGSSSCKKSQFPPPRMFRVGAKCLKLAGFEE